MITSRGVALGLSIQHIEGQLYAIYSDQLGREVRSDISSLLVLGRDLEVFLKPIIDGLRLMSAHTIKSQLRHLRALGDALTMLRATSLPKDEFAWQVLVIDIHRFIITRPDSSASLQTRVASVWMTVRGFLVVVMEAGVLPVSVYLPPVREALDSVDISAYHERLIGEKAQVSVDASATIDKLICSISLSRTDAEYLEVIRDTLAARRHVLFETLAGHWRQMKANFEFGRRLRESVVWRDLKPLVETYPLGDPANHPANPTTCIRGLANYLAVIQHVYDGCPPSDDDLRKFKRQFECLPRLSSMLPIPDWAAKYGAPDAPYGCQVWSERNVLWWWQGRLSHFDVSMIAALLIMLHPSWTPTSILFGKIANRHGKRYLDLSDRGTTYEVEKPRAKAMKKETLDPLAYEIISTLIREGADLRGALQEQGDARAALLFLPYGNKKVASPIPSLAPSYLSGSGARPPRCRLWVGAVYPELIASGMGEGTLSFAKIRNTEGVLEWFRTKSLRAVSRKLGNTEKVVLQHYIPKPILDAWNTRMVRRFQNLWISVAAANEDFLLDVTDFSNLADLHAFLKDILRLHAPTDSPLAELLHQRFDILLGSDASMVAKTANGDAHLHVAISRGALSALYSYQATVLHLGLPDAVLDKPDVITGLSPRHFLTLTDLLQSRLPEDKNPEYVACHEAAIRAASDPGNRLNWSRLLVA